MDATMTNAAREGRTGAPGDVLAHRRRALRFGPVSMRWRGRTVFVVAISLAAAILLGVVSMGSGDYSLSASRVVEILLGAGDARDQLIVGNIRLPRVLLGLLVGAALGVSGAVVQTTARNALASPDVLGVTAGASVGAVAVIVVGGTQGQAAGMLRIVGVPVAALVGGLLAATIVAAVVVWARTRGTHIVLVGVGVSVSLGGLVSWMMIAGSIDDVARANVWLTGSLNGRGWPELIPLTVVCVIAFVVLVPLSFRLPALSLGIDLARSLGVSTMRTTVSLLLVGVALAAITAAVAGPIGFVALVAPHLARLACASPRPPIVASAVIGALVVVGSDLIARTLFAPILLPTGAVTAVFGAPFLLWLLVRSRKDSPR